MIVAESIVNPERLLNKSRLTPRGRLVERASGGSCRAARSLALSLLGHMRYEQLVIREEFPGGDTTARKFGSVDAAMCAEIIVRDPRAYVALIAEGSVGLGRGFVEGWWHSDDPVTVVRVIIRNIAAVDAARNQITRWTGWMTDRVRRRLPRRTRTDNREDIATHYDLGNRFFALFLDETMTYSSAVFPHPHASLAEASLHKYDTLLNKLELTRSHRLLEIGTGWGGLALRAASTIGAQVTTTTISSEQFDESRRRVQDAGHDDLVTVLGKDWRDLDGVFDRIISIEMIEAVDWRDYDQFFQTIERCLADDGLVALQAICVPDRRYERAKNTKDFIRRFVFPNGCLPSIGAITESLTRSTGLQVVDVEDLSAHYVETLQRWRANFETNIAEIRALGLDDRFCRLWRFYLSYCEAGFSERHCTVNHFVIVARGWRHDPATPSASATDPSPRATLAPPGEPQDRCRHGVHTYAERPPLSASSTSTAACESALRTDENEYVTR